MAGYKSNSPNKFLGKIGGIIKGGGALIEGIKNRDEYGGGVKGAIKGTVGALTGGTEKNRNEEINTKLDTIIAAVSGGDEAMGADTMSTSPGAAPLSMASPAKFKEFMKTAQQSPVSNNTGGKKSTFDPVMANRMMAVSDPETNTKDLLFMLGGNIPATSGDYFKGNRPAKQDKKKASTEVKVTDEGVKVGDVKIKPYGETKGTDPAGYTKNKAGFKVNLANLPVNLKVGFDQKSTGYKSSITPSFQIGAKFNIPSGKKQKELKHT